MSSVTHQPYFDMDANSTLDERIQQTYGFTPIYLGQRHPKAISRATGVGKHKEKLVLEDYIDPDPVEADMFDSGSLEKLDAELAEV